MRKFEKSSKLDNVCYDIRGPVMDEANRMVAEGVNVLKLNIGNPAPHGLMAPDEVVRDMAYNLRDTEGYSDSKGLFSARKAIMQYAQLKKIPNVDIDDIYTGNGVSELINLSMSALLDDGDEILIPSPDYPLWTACATLAGGKAVHYICDEQSDWYPDIDDIRSKITDKTKAIVIINPNNPTGSYVKPTERARIVTLCREHGIALIADEVFFDYSLEPFPGNARLAGERGVLTFALDGFSKMLAAPHAKVGWIQVSGPAEDVAEAQRRLDVIADDYLPMSDIIAERIPALLNAAPAQTRRVGERVRNNLAKLHELLDADPNGLVSVLRAEGGWNVLLRVPSVIDENELVLRLIDEHKLTGQPGYFFDMTSNGYLAVSLLPEPDEFERGIRAVLNTVAALLR